MPLTSLSAFCKQHGLAKTSVHRYLTEELSFRLTDGMTLQAQEAALERFKPRHSEAPPLPDISPSNGHRSLQLAFDADTVDLSQFQSTFSAQVLADPEAFMENLDAFLDQVETGMNAAEQIQFSKLTQTQKTRRKGERRLQDFRLRAVEYRVKDDLVKRLQTEETEALSDIASQVMSLGKLSSPGSGVDGVGSSLDSPQS